MDALVVARNAIRAAAEPVVGTGVVGPPAVVEISVRPSTASSSARATSTAPTPSSSSHPVSTAKPTSSVAPSPTSSPSSSAPPTSSPPAQTTASSPSVTGGPNSKPTTSSEPVNNTLSTSPTPTPPSQTDNVSSVLSTETAPSASASGTLAPNAGSGSQSSPWNGSTIIGIIVGGGVFLVLVAGCCWFLGRQRRRKRRADLEDDVLGPGIDWLRRSQRLSRSGWRRSLDPEPKDQRILSPPPDVSPYTFANGPAREITHGEARDSVRMQYPLNTVGPASSRSELLMPPGRSNSAYNYPNSDRSSMWADNSEADMYVNDGSSIARTISTDTRPNSEYGHLENDPGATLATLHQAQRVYPHGMTPHDAYSEGTFVSAHSTNTFGGAFPANGAYGSLNSMACPPSQPGTYHPAPAHAQFVPVGGSSAYVPNPAMSPPSSSIRSLRPSFYEVRDAQVVPVGFVPAVQMQPQQAQFAQFAQHPQPQPQQRIPAPQLLVDTKAPINWNEHPLSGSSAMVGSSSSVSTPQSTASLVRNAAVPATPAPAAQVDPRARAVMSPTMGQPSGSFATQTRDLVAPRTVADPPYSTTAPGPAPADPAVRAAVASAAQAASATADPSAAQGSSLSRGQTIVRHADAGEAFSDAVPDGDGEGGMLHLPPAYGDIFGPPEPPRGQS